MRERLPSSEEVRMKLNTCGTVTSVSMAVEEETGCFADALREITLLRSSSQPRMAHRTSHASPGAGRRAPEGSVKTIAAGCTRRRGATTRVSKGGISLPLPDLGLCSIA